MKTVCFGEIMLRLAPENHLRFVQAEKFEVVYGGGEANVSVSLANYGIDSAFVTKLPDNPIGQSALNSLRRFGIDTTKIVRGGPRLGIYYCEKGASQRPSKVVYDRAGSSIALAKREDFDWDAILDGADWFHFTGITPALGGELPEICMDALTACRKKGIKTSCDLNYRKNLWTTEEAGRVMKGVMPFVDMCIANEEHADKVLGIRADENLTGSAVYESIARKLSACFGCEKTVITVRRSTSADDNTLTAMLYDKVTDKTCFAKPYNIHIVDRIGGGDAFAGGLIYAMLSGRTPQESIEFATAAAALKHSIEGDYNHATVGEVDALVKGGGSGRVQR